METHNCIYSFFWEEADEESEKDFAVEARNITHR